MDSSQEPAQPAASPDTRSNRTLFIVIGSVVVCVLVLFSLLRMIASFALQKAIQGATGISVNDKNGTVTVRTSEGTASFAEGQSSSSMSVSASQTTSAFGSQTNNTVSLPAGFPSDFPLPSGTMLMSAGSQASAENGGAAFMLTWDTTTPANQVLAQEQQALEQAGWTPGFQSQDATDGGAIFTRPAAGQKQDMASFSIHADQSGTTQMYLLLNLGVDQ